MRDERKPPATDPEQAAAMADATELALQYRDLAASPDEAAANINRAAQEFQRSFGDDPR